MPEAAQNVRHVQPPPYSESIDTLLVLTLYGSKGLQHAEAGPGRDGRGLRSGTPTRMPGVRLGPGPESGQRVRRTNLRFLARPAPTNMSPTAPELSRSKRTGRKK